MTSLAFYPLISSFIMSHMRRFPYCLSLLVALASILTVVNASAITWGPYDVFDFQKNVVANIRISLEYPDKFKWGEPGGLTILIEVLSLKPGYIFRVSYLKVALVTEDVVLEPPDIKDPFLYEIGMVSSLEENIKDRPGNIVYHLYLTPEEGLPAAKKLNIRKTNIAKVYVMVKIEVLDKNQEVIGSGVFYTDYNEMPLTAVVGTSEEGRWVQTVVVEQGEVKTVWELRPPESGTDLRTDIQLLLTTLVILTLVAFILVAIVLARTSKERRIKTGVGMDEKPFRLKQS